MSRLDIVVPIQGFGRGGGHRVLSNLGTEWVRSGHRVRFLCPDDGGVPYFPTEAETVRYAEGGGGLRRPLGRTRAMARALSAHAGDADLVLANYNQTAWPVAAARLRGRRGYYVQAYEPPFYDDVRGPHGVALRALARASYRLPLRQVVNSPVYFGYPGIRADRWVPPGVDLDTFRPDPGAGPVRAGRPPTMGCIGRREGWKGTADVVEAYRRLRAEGRDLRLRVAFDLPDGTVLPEGAERVVPANDAELADFYRSLDVQVAPGTDQLGGPHYPVIEALACGVPVVTTRYIPATPENAWRVPPHDPAAVAAAVADALDRPDEAARRAAAGREAVRPFAWPGVAAQLLDALLA